MITSNAQIIILKEENKIEVPFYSNLVNAGATGFPSPADDYLQSTLDLNDYFKVNINSTFYVKVIGDSMKPRIDEGDILVIDRSLNPIDGSIIVCLYNSELLVKELRLELGKASLVSTNPEYPPLIIDGENELKIWGVVKGVVKDFVKPKSKANVRSRRR